MEQTVRFILLAVGAIVVLWILYDGIKRQKRRKVEVQADENVGDVDESATDIRDAKIDYVFEERVSERASNLNLVDEIETDVADDISDEISGDQADVAGDVVMLMIVPGKGKIFSGGTLLQTLFSHDLHYGDQQIFHRYSAASENLDKPLFSVASASESGEFDLQSMRENSYRGLVVFMEPAKHLRPIDVFDLMVEVASNLAADLQGKLLSGDQQLWSDEVAAKIRATI